ncbi:uncharacterized protein DFL_009262 [Arthrobotrys flagrans]|uniref:Uncharacterized protein n=1 Tax=Arthrobotrys flagrans TaxID=97331 RepID=A0A436ZRL2_ARTFL|nr:hypothetical protein DFL_009262 [Arthrobotrys flagrans]
MTWNLKDYLKDTPLRAGAMPSDFQEFGSESIFEIINEAAGVVTQLLDIIVKFEEDATEEDYIADLEFDITRKGFSCASKDKSCDTADTKVKIDTPIEIYIPEELNGQIVFVMGQKLLGKVELYLDGVNKLGRYLGKFSKDAMRLIEDLPEDWDRED